MKKVIGIILILIGAFFGIGGLWALTAGGDVVGAIVMALVGFTALGFGIKLVRS